MIKVSDVSFKYKNSNKNILEHLNFEINDGEIVTIVGKNGSGKSTIGKLISGIIKLKEGNIEIDGLDIRKNNKLIHENVGIVFQNPENQIIFNNIYDEISFILKDLNKNEIDEKIDLALKEVNMIEYKNEDLYTLSLGQKQKMMIAEVLAKNPKYIIFDEPTTMLDSKGKEEIYDIIRKLKKDGYTVICITNVSDEILIADKTFILNNGRIEAQIKKEELLEKAYLFEKFDIKKPTIIELLIKLKENGIDIDLKDDFTIQNLVNELREKI